MAEAEHTRYTDTLLNTLQGQSLCIMIVDASFYDFNAALNLIMKNAGHCVGVTVSNMEDGTLGPALLERNKTVFVTGGYNQATSYHTGSTDGNDKVSLA
jgi:succinate dehydrogenase/fumarate reductase flavoprotein subunit